MYAQVIFRLLPHEWWREEGGGRGRGVEGRTFSGVVSAIDVNITTVTGMRGLGGGIVVTLILSELRQ